MVNALIDKGKDGYDQIQQKMNKQASLNKRVQAQLGTLSNLWEAMTGTATNGLAAIGGAFSGDAKNITQWLGELGEKFTKFADENPRVTLLIRRWIRLRQTTPPMPQARIPS